MSKVPALALLIQPSPAFGGFLEYLIDEAGFRVAHVESAQEARLQRDEAQPAFVLICSSLVEDARAAGQLDAGSTVVLVGPSGAVCPGLQCVPKLFAPAQLRRAVSALESGAAP